MKDSGGEIHVASWGKERIEFRLRRTDRRTLAITVKPNLDVTVTAPKQAAVEAVSGKVRKRAGWIRRQQRFFREFLPEMPPRRFVSGETHRYLGRQYRLKILSADESCVKLKGPLLWVYTTGKQDTAGVRKLVTDWYFVHAKARLARSLAESMARLGPRLTGVPQMRFRRMPNRWGSCTSRGVIYLNPELVKAPPSCIDYVMTHELCHMVYGHHGTKFYALLRRAMPDWEARKGRLETMMAN